MWNFDGVACAAALELGNPVFLFHSNHLFYGFLGSLFWKPLFPWALPRALPALQLFTSLLSAAGLVGLYRILEKLLSDKGLALLTTLCVSVTAVVWVWSVEAQVYALGFLAVSWATYELLRPESPHKWYRVGALHAAAVLGHIVHVLWIVPALYWFRKEHLGRKKLRHYLVTLGVGMIVPYALVIGFVVDPGHLNDRWLHKWLMGSASLNPNSMFQWHSAGVMGPLLWAATALRVFWGSFWPYQTNVPPWCWFLTALSALVLLVLLGSSFKQKRDARWAFCMLWLAVYGLFFWTWEPTTECYRMTDLIPLAMLLALGATTWKERSVRWILLTLLFATLLPVNLRTRIYPMNDPQRNLIYQNTIDLANRTPSESIYLTIGGITWIYLLYFSGRTAWDLHSFMRDPDRLGREIARHYSTRPVFIQTYALETDLVKPWLTHYKLHPLGHSLPWLQLQ